jgi:hypothetical protein
VTTTNTPGVPDHAATPDRASFLARSKKAIAGGVAAGVTAGTTALATAASDGMLSSGDAWVVAGAVVGGFAVGFVGVWAAPANAS